MASPTANESSLHANAPLARTTRDIVAPCGCRYVETPAEHMDEWPELTLVRDCGGHSGEVA